MTAAFPLLIAWTLMVAIYVDSTRDPDVAGNEFAIGLAVGTVTIGVLPSLLYFALGRKIRYPTLLVLVWPISVVPAGFYLLFAGLLTADLTSCPPDAYECPI